MRALDTDREYELFVGGHLIGIGAAVSLGSDREAVNFARQLYDNHEQWTLKVLLTHTIVRRHATDYWHFTDSMTFRITMPPSVP